MQTYQPATCKSSEYLTQLHSRAYIVCKMQTFADWLEARLAERGWRAADLTAASRDDELPRGLDPGLISRWRRPPPDAVVPNQAKTLTRLAKALGVSEDEVYVAAGLKPKSNPESAARLHPRLLAFMAHVEAAFHSMTEQEWDVREDAGRSLFSVGRSVNPHPKGPAKPRRARINTHSSRDDSGPDNTLATTYHRTGQALTLNFARP